MSKREYSDNSDEEFSENKSKRIDEILYLNGLLTYLESQFNKEVFDCEIP